METNEKITVGVICFLTMLAGFGGNMYLSKDKIDNTYICELTEEIGIFDRISSSKKTGYYINELGDEKGVRCQKNRVYGTWIPIKEYADEMNIDINELLNKEPEIPKPNYYSNSRTWLCDNVTCIPF